MSSANFLSAQRRLFGGPRGLPHALERALWHLGFVDVRVVDGSGDDGADLLAVRGGEQWVFQCKWSSRGPIDRSGIDDLERARTRYGADKAVLATNTSINRTAEERRKTLASIGINISVWDGPTLSQIWEKMPDRVAAPFKLREYQTEAVEAIEADLRDTGTALLVLATGLGKTVIGGEVINRHLTANPNASVLVTAHMKELVEQLERALWRHLDKRVPTRLLTGDTKPPTSYGGVLVGTIESVLGAVRAEQHLPSLIMIDETHHVGENSKFAELLDLCGDEKDPQDAIPTNRSKHFGVTATPWRGDKFDITTRFGEPSFRMGIAEGMKAGYLAAVDYRLFVDNIDWEFVRQASAHQYSVRELNRSLFLPQRDGEVIETLREAWRETQDPRAILFCQTIEHAEHMAGLLAASDQAWARAAFLHSALPRQRRQILLNEFRLGRVPVITCVDVFNEGVDVPDVNLIGFLRVTHSRRIFVQQLGRGLRLSPGKKELKVLDFVTDIRRVAATLDLRRSLEYAGREDLRLGRAAGTINFSDETVGTLLDHWIKDAASLETANDDVMLQFPDGLGGID